MPWAEECAREVPPVRHRHVQQINHLEIIDNLSRWFWIDRRARLTLGPGPGSPGSALRATLREYVPGADHGLADDGHPDVARHVDQDLDQLLLGPALPERHAQVDPQLGLPAGRRVGHHAHERPGLEVETGPGPERAEDVLGRHG